MNFQIAADQFADIIARNGGDVQFAHDNPEQYDHYAGLMNLARGLEQLRMAVEEIRARVNTL